MLKQNIFICCAEWWLISLIFGKRSMHTGFHILFSTYINLFTLNSWSEKQISLLYTVCPETSKHKKCSGISNQYLYMIRLHTVQRGRLFSWELYRGKTNEYVHSQILPADCWHSYIRFPNKNQPPYGEITVDVFSSLQAMNMFFMILLG